MHGARFVLAAAVMASAAAAGVAAVGAGPAWRVIAGAIEGPETEVQAIRPGPGGDYVVYADPGRGDAPDDVPFFAARLGTEPGPAAELGLSIDAQSVSPGLMTLTDNNGESRLVVLTGGGLNIEPNRFDAGSPILVTKDGSYGVRGDEVVRLDKAGTVQVSYPVPALATGDLTIDGKPIKGPRGGRTGVAALITDSRADVILVTHNLASSSVVDLTKIGRAHV